MHKKEKMKQYLLLIILLGFSSNSANAQYSYTPATIFLKSGKTLVGDVDLKTNSLLDLAPKEEHVKFKKNNRKQNIEAKVIDSIVFTVTIEKRINKKKVSYTEQQKFVPIYIKKKKKYLRMVRLVIDDKLKLYSRSVKTGAAMSGNGNFYSYGNGNNQYFVAKTDNAIPMSLLPRGPKKFRKEAAKYFSDCQALVDKINSKTFERSDIVDIAKYYNSNCTK